MKLVFASNNRHKIKEISDLLPPFIEVVSLEDIGCTEEIPETSNTIEGNAILKANYVTKKYGLPCFADDTGLEIEALDGAPGVYSARYAGQPKDDQANINLVLDNLKYETNRNAQFKTVIALQMHNQQHLFTGIVKGTLLTHKKGTAGFGYDPIFVPETASKTFAEMTSEEKNQMSHRGKAVNQLVSFLLDYKS